MGETQQHTVVTPTMLGLGMLTSCTYNCGPPSAHAGSSCGTDLEQDRFELRGSTELCTVGKKL